MTRKKIIWLSITGIIAICGLILFVITQDMRRTMVFVDIWTLLHMLFTAINIAACFFVVGRIKAIVSFDGSTGRTPLKRKVRIGEALEEPYAPTRKGYAFEGWYTDREFSNKWDFNETVESDVSLFAKWTAQAESSIATLQQPSLQPSPG